jgi:predicted outer membrane repeat protein
MTPLAVLSLLVALTGPTPLYVDDDATGANDGSSWADAFVDLQDALAATTPGREIWVAAGTYRPTTDGDRTVSFRPGQSTLLYGGFDGTETSLAERAGLFESTVLDGDLAGDDGPDFSNRVDNSEHVFEMDVSVGTRVDGFTIRGGSALSSPGGGAWFATALSCSQARNCTFVDNQAVAGGAVWGGGFSLDAFIGCVFAGNRAEQGGAAWVSGGPAPISFRRSLFANNVATERGGGAIAAGYTEVSNCVFVGNSADGATEGGGAFWGGGWIRHSTFWANRALGGAAGGGVFGDSVVDASILWGNADTSGMGAEAQYATQNGFGWIDASCVQGWTPAFGGEEMLASAPEFLDPLGADGVAGTVDDDLRLGPLSPCVDRRPALAWTAVDFDGLRRSVDARTCDTRITDLGAFERQAFESAPRFCPGLPSSLGVAAELRAPCSANPLAGTISVFAQPVPPTLGELWLGSLRVDLPFNGGLTCLAGDVRRLAPVRSSAGTLVLGFDPALVPGGPLPVGTSWNLQAVYRDAAVGGNGALTSDAAVLTLLP